MDSPILERIDAPDDLKPLTYEEMTQVAQEARDTIISVITERGGHLASNLGVVELTLALHRVFDSPRDKIVWDTTNQLYTHKLVTGRRDEFKNIRLQGGLSGFGEPGESEHDTLCAGTRRHRVVSRAGRRSRRGQPQPGFVDDCRRGRWRDDIRLQLRGAEQHRASQPREDDRSA